MTALADACADYAAAIPLAEALIAHPDTDGTTGRGQPSSRPPWNGAVAMALLDALEGARRLDAAWRSQAAGRPVPRRPMRMTGAVLASLQRLEHALPSCPPAEYDDKNRPLPCQCDRCCGIRDLGRWTLPIWQLAAVDLDERAVKITAVCPYCRYPVLLARIRERKVACPRGVRDKDRALVCADSDGNPPKGQMGYSRLDGTPQIEWNDGLVT